MTNVNNVALGKPKVGGAIFRSPLGAPLPTDATSPLDAAFVEQGYVSDEGVAREISRSYDSVKAWGGDEVANPRSEETIRLNFALIEANNPNVLRSAYGDDAVAVNGSLITVDYRGTEVADSSWVIDMAYKGVLRRVVLPHAANVTEDFSQTFNDADPVSLPFSLAARKDAFGSYFRDYIEGGSPDAPRIASITPAGQSAGDSVYIHGQGFTSATAVTVAGVAATAFSAPDDSLIAVVIPEGVEAGPAAVVVATPAGTASGS
ncbi:MAG: IPT/TIG domain-containing protein, partial [Bifidobacteriaceae bacterium]|nr:IPT/TIG domain-containing protein [Bifidobacteriaceae bacterium]